MSIFKLPDLGEGLAEAEIREWYVKEGDEVTTEQPLCSMETAKAVVDVPSPHAGKITKLYGKVGDIIKTGAPLVAFDDAEKKVAADAGTVVGRLESGQTILKESPTGISVQRDASARIKASPAVRALAKELNVDLNSITATGPGGSITMTDVKQALGTKDATTAVTGEALHGARRAMAMFATKTYHNTVPITLMDCVDINEWTANTDITFRIIHAMIQACEKEPSLNAHFYGEQLTRQLFKEINVGIAVDTVEGLYVPVIKNVEQKNQQQIRQEINRFKELAKQGNFSPDDLKGATIVLTNFGAIAGRYANPMLVPPTVAILGVGKSYQECVSNNKQTEFHRILPLSITFDHRAVTGGEAARFLATVIDSLLQAK